MDPNDYRFQLPHTEECFHCGAVHTTPSDMCYLGGCPKCKPEKYADSEIDSLRLSALDELVRRNKEVQNESK